MDELTSLRKKISDLEQKNRLFNETEEAGKIGGWQFDPETLKQSWTEEVFRILEIDLKHGAPEVPKGLEFIDPEYRSMAEKAIQRAMEYGEPYNQEWVVTTHKGNKKWVNAVCNPKMKNGKVVTVSGSFQDITAKKKADGESKNSELRLHKVLDNSPFPTAVVDENDQNLMYWSKSAFQLFGHDPKTTQEWYELAYPNPEYRQQVLERWKPFLETAQQSNKAVNTGEYEIRCKDGSVKICEIYAQFIPGSLVVTLNDITDRKKSEERLNSLNQQLQANEQQLRAANQQLQASEQQLKFDQETLKRTQKIAHIGSWDWDVASDKVSWSDELFQIFRLDPKKGAVPYADHPNIYTPESMKLLDAAVQHTLETGEPYKMDVEIIRGDGTNAFCSVRGFAKKDKKGKIVQLYGSFQDITDRKNSEEQLKALNQQLQANEQQLRAVNQQLQANEQQLRAANQQLEANEQQLRAANQQLEANEQQLRAANQQLQANEQQLKATNQELNANQIFLRDSKETAERYLNIAAEIILSLDSKGNILMLNDSGYQLLGYQKGTLIGKEWFSHCLPEKIVGEVKSVFDQLMKGDVENVANYESVIITKSGEIKTILWHNTVLKDDNGSIIGTLSSGEDITESVKTRNELAASETFLKTIFEKSLNAIVVADDAGNYISVNEAAAQLFGYPKDKLAKMNVSEIIKTENPNAEEKYKQYIEGGKETGEIEFTTPDTQKKVAQYNAIRIRKDFNLSILHDISENKKAEQELKRSELKFQNIAENVPGLVLRYQLFPNGSDKLVFISKSVEDIYEIPRQDALNNAGLLWNMIHPDDLDEYKKTIEEAVKNLSYWKHEHRILLPDGRVKWLLGIAVPVKQEDGSTIFDTLGINITDQKKIEKDLIEAKEKTEENESRYRNLVETASDGIYLISEDGIIIDTNKGAMEMLGKEKDEIVGLKLDSVDPNHHINALLDFWKDVPFNKQQRFETTHQHKNGNLIPVEISAKKYLQDDETFYYSIARDISERKQAEAELKKIEWLLQPKKEKTEIETPNYGDLTAINQDGTILNAVGKDMLNEIVGDYLSLLETSAAVYEKNGDYATGIFSSEWCQFLDCSSRALCKSKNNKKALESGKWLCHESCWGDASKQTMQTNKATDIECSGGLHIYAIPIRANGEVIGAINFGYGNPPTDEETLEEIADKYKVSIDKLRDLAHRYETRPAFIIDIAKERLESSSRFIGNIVERKQMEVALIKAKELAEQSNANVTAIIEGNNNSIWAFDRNYDILYINQVFRQEFHQSFGVLLKPGMNLVKALPQELQPFWKPRYDRVLANEQFTLEDAVPTDIGTIYIEVSFNPIIKDGKVIGGSCFGSNITSRKNAEIELRKAKEKAEESERKLTEAQKLSHLGSWEYIIDTDTVIWSKELFNIFERSLDLPAPNYSLQKPFYTEESFAKLDKAIQDCVQREIPYEIELDIILPSGAIKQIISRGDVLKDQNNKVIGSYGTAQDITQRKKSEQELLKAKEKAEEIAADLKLAQKIANIGNWHFDPELGYPVWSDHVYKIYERNPEDGVPHIDDYKTIYEPDQYEIFMKAFTAAINEGQSYDIELKLLLSKDRIKWVRAICRPDLKRKSNSGYFLSGTIQDISHSKKIESELLLAKEKAEAANIHKNYFLANMSHEIRTPMNGVLGFTNILLEEDFSAEERTKYLHIIERNSQQLLALIDDIIDVAKIESNELKISIGKCKVSEIFNDLEENFNQIKLKLNKEQVDLKLNIPSKYQGLVIHTDAHRLRQVISNLINNAIKFSEKGSITFGFHVKKSLVEFYVSDQGIGIPQEKLTEIFERFKQLNYKNAAKYGGTGLGLAISRGIIKKLGGTISVKSEPKKGSTFSFKLPINESDKA